MKGKGIKEGFLIGDRYQVERSLGQGSVGCVYLCRDIADGGSRVAVKILVSRNPSERELVSLREEFALLSRLRHPNLVRIVDFGSLQENGCPYLVEEYVGGVDAFTATEKWNEEMIVHLLVKLCRVMQYLHSRGICHRDLKPSNVMVDQRKPGGENLKVLDFGLARWEESDRTWEEGGTVAYTAPEVLLGESAGTKSDLYSLGILAYQLLSRRLPFEGVDAGFLMQMQLQGRPDMQAIERCAFGSGLSLAVKCLLEKIPENRPSSAEEVIRMLSVAVGKDLGTASSDVLESYFSAGRFVGRERELALLQDRASSVKSSGRGCSVYLIGEGGSGKSRCADELRIWALLEGWRVIKAQCLQNEGRSYGPFRQVLEKTAAAKGVLNADLSRFEDLLPKIAEGMTIFESSSEAAGRFRDQLTREIVQRLKGRPTILILDDFHWADEATTAVLDFLGSDIQSYPIMLCVCLRPGEGGSSHLERLIDQSIRQVRGEKLILETLSEESVRELFASMTGQHEMGIASGTWLYKSSGGNPFFVEEILKQLVDRDFLTREQNKWKLDENALKSMEVPAGIAVVLRDRLSQLSGPARELAGWLAVINRSMTKEMIQRIVGQKPSAFQDSLNELQARQIIKCENRDGSAHIEFCHGLIAEVILTGLATGKRRFMHRQIGEALEEEDGSKNRVQEIAMHYMEGKHGDKALRYACDAAAQCRVEFAHEFAWRCYEYLLTYGKTISKEKRCETAIEAAGTLCALGMPRRAIQVLTGELSRYRKIELDLKAKMLMQIAFSYQHLGDLRMLQKTSSRGLRLFRRHKSGKASVTQAALLTQLSYCALMHSQLKLGLCLLNQAKQCMSLGDPETLIGIIYNLEAALYRVGCNLHEALAAGNKAAWAFENCAESERAAACYSVLGVCLTLLGRFPRALQVHSRAVDLSESSRSTILKALALANYSECLCRIGDVEQSILISERASKSVSDARNPGISYAFNAILAEIKSVANEYQEAERILKRLRIETGNNLPVFTKSHIHYVSANLHFTVGDFEKAIIDLDQLADSQTGEAPAYHLELGEVLRALIYEERGQRLKALQILNSMDKLVSRKRWPYQMSIVKSHLGEILLRTGQWSAARKNIINAGRLAKAMNCIPLMSFSHYLMGLYYEKMSALNCDSSLCGNQTAEGPNYGPAQAAFEKSLELASRTGLSDTTWRAHLEMSKMLIAKSKFEASLSHSRKALECLNAMERQVPPAMLSRFLDTFERSHAKAELPALISRAEAHEREAGMAVEKMQEDHVRILLRASNRLNAIREVEPLLEVVVDLLLRSIGAHRAFVFLKDRPSGKLRLAKGCDSRSGSLSKAEGISESILEEVIRMGRPFVSANALQDPRASGRESVISYQLGTVLCAPLVLSGRVLGILYADHALAVRSLSESTINLFAAFCSIVAVALDNALSHRQLLREKKDLEDHLNATADSFPEIIGKSAATRILRERLALVAASPLDVLIVGESGTGKEMVARAIHRTGKRTAGVFMPVDCGSFSESLIESELFGYRKGSFTGAIENRAGLMEAAHGGILFLDEISNFPIRLQSVLLRVLQEREVRRIGETMSRKIDVRVIAASNKNLKQEIEQGRFREDLYYRLNAMEIRISPLRERAEDIPLLLDWFLAKLTERECGRVKEFSPETMDFLCRYSYPGNVRELKNIVESSYYSGAGSMIQVEDLPAEVRDGKSRASEMVQTESYGRQLFKQIRDGAGDFEAMVKRPFLKHQFGSSVIREVLDAALCEARGKYREAFRLLKIPERSYAVMMQFLKRHGCYLDYRPFRCDLDE